MIPVGTAVLKNRLSYYLAKVRNGAQIVVTDHGVPIARIVPTDPEFAPTLEELVAQLVRENAAEYTFKTKSFSKVKPKKLRDSSGAPKTVSQMVIEDRA